MLSLSPDHEDHEREITCLCRYRVNADEDSWQGYLVERQKLFQALGGASNAVVYSGDSHNFW